MSHEKFSYSPYQINMLNDWEAYLASHEELLCTRFKAIVDRYHIDNWAKLKGKDKKVIELEFFHGSGQLDFNFSARTSDDDEFNEVYSPEPLVPEYDYYNYVKNDFEYPSSLDIQYEEFRENRAEVEKWNLTFEWLVNNWIKCEGHTIGIVTGTWQNNAASTFSLNLMNWDDSIELPDASENKKAPYPLVRALTPFEVRQRVKMSSYTPFRTIYRYFEKGEYFFEIAKYANLLAVREGKVEQFEQLTFTVTEGDFDYQIMRFHNLKKMAKICDDKINEGFAEKPRPSNGPRVHADLIEWDFGPFLRDFEEIPASTFTEFKEKTDLEIPRDYRWFIERMNNVAPNWNLNRFRITGRRWRKIERIFRFENVFKEYVDFHRKNETDKNLIPIIQDVENGFVLINAENGQVFYGIKTFEQINTSFAAFIEGSTTEGSYFDPMCYHLEKNNVGMVRKWVSEGVDVRNKKLFRNRSAISISRNIEILELLLQHDVDPNEATLFSGMTTDYLQLLVDYGFDLKSKVAEQNWFLKEMRKNPEFKDLLDRIE